MCYNSYKQILILKSDEDHLKKELGTVIMDLIIFNDIEQDKCIKGLMERDSIALLRGMVEFAETEGVTNDCIREYVASFLANDDNLASRILQRGGEIGNDLMRLIKSDMTFVFKNLYSKQTIKYTPSGNPTGFCDAYIKSIRAITAADEPELLMQRLLEHYKTLGCGITAKYIAFKYNGALEGVSDVDLISFNSLVGIDYQRDMLIDNTRAFIEGKTSNNVLLFGDRGTGKSSCVKALLDMFADDGLRLIEVPKQYISDIPKLSKMLSEKPHKYIIFLDDLSFETHESEYRALKIAMEGQLQANPDNVIIYATSNRRHLIRETWADRDGGEIHKNDQIQETMSLAERFGLSLVFSAPNQKEYLNIVKSMLKEKGIEMTGELEKKAIVWQMNYGGRNGRCARQFISSLR